MAREMVQVWNDDSQDYSENFKGNQVVVPAGEFISMSRNEANAFMGSFSGKVNNRLVTKSLRLVRSGDYDDSSEAEKFISQMTGEEFDSQQDLDNHLKSYKGQQVTIEALEKKVKAGPELVDGKIQCPLCGKPVKAGKANLKGHLQSSACTGPDTAPTKQE